MGETHDVTSTHLNLSGLFPTVIEKDSDAIIIINEESRSKANIDMATMLLGRWTEVKEEYI